MKCIAYIYKIGSGKRVYAAGVGHSRKALVHLRMLSQPGLYIGQAAHHNSRSLRLARSAGRPGRHRSVDTIQVCGDLQSKMEIPRITLA